MAFCDYPEEGENCPTTTVPDSSTPTTVTESTLPSSTTSSTTTTIPNTTTTEVVSTTSSTVSETTTSLGIQVLANTGGDPIWPVGLLLAGIGACLIPFGRKWAGR